MVSETINFNVLERSRNVVVAPDEITEPWDDTSIGLRGELDGAEYYALIRIYNAHILTQEEKDLIVSIIHGPYPRSNVYWHERHETDETGVE